MFNIARVASLSTFHKPKGILYQGGKKLVYEDNSGSHYFYCTNSFAVPGIALRGQTTRLKGNYVLISHTSLTNVAMLC